MPSSSPTALLSKTTRIGVLCGGLSSERAVSLRSGRNCLAALHRLGYTHAVLVDVGRHVAEQLKAEAIEVAFLALHGPYGEDGCIQGLLEWLGIPYTGCRVAASAIAMDKALTKRLLAEAGLPVLSSAVINRSMSQKAMAAITEAWDHYPVMVKPANGGSSVGMAKVERADQLSEAITQALAVDHTVLLEPYFTGVDATTGVVEVAGELVVTPVLELRSKTGWYDEAAKYTAGLTEFICPASFNPTLTERLQTASLQAFKAIGCHGVARIDGVVNAATDEFVLLEVNTIPGMTDVSDLPAQCLAMGMDYDTLVSHLLATAFTATTGNLAPLANTPNPVALA